MILAVYFTVIRDTDIFTVSEPLDLFLSFVECLRSSEPLFYGESFSFFFTASEPLLYGGTFTTCRFLFYGECAEFVTTSLSR